MIYLPTCLLNWQPESKIQQLTRGWIILSFLWRIKLALDETGSPLQVRAPNPFSLPGPYFLTQETDEGYRDWAQIVGLLEDKNIELAKYQKDPSMLKFKIAFDNDKNQKGILSYNDILHCIEQENNKDGGTYWKFWNIIGHEETSIGHPNRKGRSHNVTIKWENGSVGPKPLVLIAKDCPVKYGQYAINNNLLNVDGWKQFRRLAKREKLMKWLLKQAKLRSFCTSPVYKFDYRVPKDWKEAKGLDKKNGNQEWAEAKKIEMN